MARFSFQNEDDGWIMYKKRRTDETGSTSGGGAAGSSGHRATAPPPQVKQEPDPIPEDEEEEEEEEEFESEEEESEQEADEEEGQEDDDEQLEDEEEEENPIVVPTGSSRGARSGSVAAQDDSGRVTISDTVSSGNGSGQGPVSVFLSEPDVLDCPICLEHLGPPVYQCENGHIACASCCIKMGNKCANCSYPIGYNRCRAIENVLESIKVSCRFADYGCTETVSYSKKRKHEKTCSYLPCSCPSCHYVGTPERMYKHFSTSHSTTAWRFNFDTSFIVQLERASKKIILQERKENTIFALNQSVGNHGRSFKLVCIGSPRKEFKYHLKVEYEGDSIELKSCAENMRKWVERPMVRNYLFVPDGFNAIGPLVLTLDICGGKSSSCSHGNR